MNKEETKEKEDQEQTPIEKRENGMKHNITEKNRERCCSCSVKGKEVLSRLLDDR